MSSAKFVSRCEVSKDGRIFQVDLPKDTVWLGAVVDVFFDKEWLCDCEVIRILGSKRCSMERYRNISFFVK